MKTLFVVMRSDTDYVWNGENSVPVTTEYPSMIFESKEDAESNAQGETVYEVNWYAKGEKVI